MKNHIEAKELHLEGFHCADCAATIEKTVAKLAGVKSVEANYAAGKVNVEYDPDALQYDDLLQTVERIGYKVQSTNHVDYGQKKAPWKDREFLYTALSGLALAVGLLLPRLHLDPLLMQLGPREFFPSTIFYFASIALGAYFFARAGWAAIRNVQINMNFLMTVAIIGAIIIGEYVEAASLAFLFSMAELLEGYAVQRARNSLRELMTLAPQEATLKTKDGTKTVAVQDVAVGDILITRPGERIALDGQVVLGASSVNQSPITGESVPVTKNVGDRVYAGSINGEGYLEVRITEKSDQTMIAKIIRLIEDAEKQKAPSERFVDKFARIYTPVVVSVAILIATLPPLFFGADLHDWFAKALTLLVIACPCALVISTPVSVVSALTSASRNGVLIKGGEFLEGMSQVEVIAFDKTGTLTTGRLAVTDIIPLDSKTAEEVLQVAAALEARSSHPIAEAILQARDGKTLLEVTDAQTLPGLGVRGKILGETYLVGREALFEKNALTDSHPRIKKLQEEGKTTMLVGTANNVLGVIGLLDDIRKDAIETVALLQRAGKKLVMVTGDNRETAKAIAERLNLPDYKAGLLPEEKVAEIRSLRRRYGRVAMVGDGINDAPALAAASIGIAMGVAGTDTALETANIALMSDDLTKIPYLVTLSQRARRVIKQNIFASILIKFTLAIGVFPGLVSLVTAVLVGDMGASLAVTSNAMKLARSQTRKN